MPLLCDLVIAKSTVEALSPNPLLFLSSKRYHRIYPLKRQVKSISKFPALDFPISLFSFPLSSFLWYFMFHLIYWFISRWRSLSKLRIPEEKYSPIRIPGGISWKVSGLSLWGISSICVLNTNLNVTYHLHHF